MRAHRLDLQQSSPNSLQYIDLAVGGTCYLKAFFEIEVHIQVCVHTHLRALNLVLHVQPCIQLQYFINLVLFQKSFKIYNKRYWGMEIDPQSCQDSSPIAVHLSRKFMKVLIPTNISMVLVFNYKLSAVLQLSIIFKIGCFKTTVRLPSSPNSQLCRNFAALTPTCIHVSWVLLEFLVL